MQQLELVHASLQRRDIVEKVHARAEKVHARCRSKSLGNFFTIREVLKQYHPMALRWFLLNSQYRAPINYTTQALDEASDRLYYIYSTLQATHDALVAAGAALSVTRNSSTGRSIPLLPSSRHNSTDGHLPTTALIADISCQGISPEHSHDLSCMCRRRATHGGHVPRACYERSVDWGAAGSLR